MKRELRVRFDFLKPGPDSRVMEKQTLQKKGHDQHSTSRQFFLGQAVMAKNFRPGPAWIPAIIVERLGPLSYLIETEDRECWRRHIDHLKELLLPEHLPETTTSSPVMDTSPVVSVPDADSQMLDSTVISAEPALPPRSETAEVSTSSTTATPRAEPGVNLDVLSSSATATPVSTWTYPRRERRPPDYYRPSD